MLCARQLDEDLRSWLIEVNTNPYLGVQNPWHGKLLMRMIEDMTRLAIDPVFPPPSGHHRPSTPTSTPASTVPTVSRPSRRW